MLVDISSVSHSKLLEPWGVVPQTTLHAQGRTSVFFCYHQSPQTLKKPRKLYGYLCPKQSSLSFSLNSSVAKSIKLWHFQTGIESLSMFFSLKCCNFWSICKHLLSGCCNVEFLLAIFIFMQAGWNIMQMKCQLDLASPFSRHTETVNSRLEMT